MKTPWGGIAEGRLDNLGKAPCPKVLDGDSRCVILILRTLGTFRRKGQPDRGLAPSILSGECASRGLELAQLPLTFINPEPKEILLIEPFVSEGPDEALQLAGGLRRASILPVYEFEC